MINSSWMLPVIVVLAACISGVFTAVARVLSQRFGLVDRPDGERKAHDRPIPLGGGVALYGSFVMAVFLAQWFGLRCFLPGTVSHNLLPVLTISAGLFCLIGLWDDKWVLRVRYKFLLQIVACLPFALWGKSIDSINMLGVEFYLGTLGMAFTVFWLVACVNIVNLIDGLDGLAGTLTAIVCLTLATVAMMDNKQDTATIALILMGCILGFLLHNLPPAKIFLGDSGSLLVGYLIGALSIEATSKTTTGFGMAVPVILMGVPIFDTAMAILRRNLNGRHVAEPDREHIHHRLQDRGLTQAQSLLAISIMCVVMAIAAIISHVMQNDMVAFTAGTLILSVLIGGRIFGYDETVLFFRSVKEVGFVLWQSTRALRIWLIPSGRIREQVLKLNPMRADTIQISQAQHSRLQDTAVADEGDDDSLPTDRRRAA